MQLNVHTSRKRRQIQVKSNTLYSYSILNSDHNREKLLFLSHIPLEVRVGKRERGKPTSNKSTILKRQLL